MHNEKSYSNDGYVIGENKTLEKVDLGFIMSSDSKGLKQCRKVVNMINTGLYDLHM